MDKTIESIEQFIKIFEENLNAIRNAEFTVRDNLFKKILCVGIIDALSKTVYPNPNKGNPERFTLFAKNICNWKNGEKISLPHLVRLLKNAPEPEYSDLRKYSLRLY